MKLFVQGRSQSSRSLADHARLSLCGILGIALLACGVSFMSGRADELDQWTRRGQIDPAFILHDVIWGSDVFVAGGASISTPVIGGRAMLYSPTGANWHNASPTLNQPLGTQIWDAWPVYGLAYGQGLFVAVQNLDNSGGQYSTNGSDWYAIWPGPVPAGLGVAYGNRMFVSVAEGGFAGKFSISNDGKTWSMLPDPTTDPLFSVAFGAGIFVAVGGWGYSGTIVVSTNGVDWKA